MTATRTIQRFQGLGTLAGAVATAGLLLWSALTPVLDLRQSITDVTNRIERFKRSAHSSETRNIDTSMVISTGETTANRSLAIQRALVDDTAAAGLRIRQLSAATPREVKPGLVQLSYEIDASGDLGHLTAISKLLADRRPALFIDKLVVKSGPGPRPDLDLSVEMVVSAYVLPPAGKQ
jgi:hypothetical protein